MGSLALAPAALALPTGGVVAAGGATISGAPASLLITQSTQNAAINWQGFSIGAAESVQFVQPNAAAVALNRVLGSDPSTIMGRLSANGQVFLVNPNGVLFGHGAEVNTAGLVASTFDITDADLMNGRYRFAGAAGGSVVNQGLINAEGGFVALLASHVRNDGVISARLGTVALAAGSAMTLDVVDGGLLSVTVDKGAMNALVQNGGVLRADGGQVLMTTGAATGLLRAAVNNTGVVEARTIENRRGVIRLVSDATGGSASVGGSLDASGAGEGETGGRIEVFAHDVTLAGDARLQASGDLGGGFVETSGAKVKVSEGAVVDTLARNGKTGLWLLDPVNYTISAGGDETPAQVTTSLAASDRLIQATSDITVADPITWGSAQRLTLQAGQDIHLDAAVTATSANAALILIAGRNIQGAGGANISQANGLLRFTAGNNLTVGGALVASAAGARIELTAGTDLTVAAAMTSSGGGSIALKAGHNVIQSAAITSSGGTGSIVMTADNDGTGGVGGGTVILNGPAAVTSDALSIFYSPENGYATPNAYAGVSVAPGAVTKKMWVFATAQDKTYDGGAGATLTFVGDPTAGGVNAVSLAGGASFNDAGAGTQTVNLAGVTLGGADVPKFALFNRPASATIGPAGLVVRANDATKIFGQALSSPGTAFTSSGLVGGETIGSVSFTSPGAAASATPAGNPYVLTPYGATGGSFNPGNYSISYVNGLLTVTRAPLLVTANSLTKTFGQVITFSGQEFTTTGLLNGDTIGSVTNASTGAAATAAVAGGPYAITPSNATGGSFVAANYLVTYVPGKLTVAPAPIVVTANNANKSYGDTTAFSGQEFTVSGLKNGDTVGRATLASPGAAPTASVAGSPYVIAASNVSGGSFTPSNYAINYVPGVLTVSPAALQIQANSATKPYGDVITYTGQEFTASGLKNGDTVGGATVASAGAGATASVVGGPYAVVASNVAGGDFVPANYAISYANGVLTVAPATLVVTAGSGSKYFLEPYVFTGTEFTAVGLKNGETVGAVTLTSPGAATSANASSTPYPISASGASGGSFSPSNYSTTYVAGRLSVAAPTSIAGSGARALTEVDRGSSSGFTPNPLTDADYAVGGGPFATDASAGEGSSGGTTLPNSGTPAGVRLAVLDNGVRMPAVFVASRRVEAQQAPAQQALTSQAAPVDTAAPASAEVAAPVRAPAPYAAPVRKPKQDRN